MHLHGGIALDKLDLDDIGKDKLQAELADRGNHKREEGCVQAAVKQDKRDGQHHCDERTNLGDEAEEKGHEAKNGGQLNPEHPEHHANTKPIAKASSTLQDKVAQENAFGLGVDGHRCAQPEHHVEAQHQELNQQFPCVRKELGEQVGCDGLGATCQRLLRDLVNNAPRHLAKDVCDDHPCVVHCICHTLLVDFEVLLHAQRARKDEHSEAAQRAHNDRQRAGDSHHTGDAGATASTAALHIRGVRDTPEVARAVAALCGKAVGS
mmetsp:Transcript_30598/g.84383  ORF Transcript_30598/g.84383 Transcript_30598/m.84383 type:complete len:265 (-) Transcript_30598:485-1279(-)